MPTRILIGTASWQEPEFIEHWYPKALPKSKLLPYYAEHFGFVEVNGSFYGIPLAKNTAQWCQQTPDNFVFNVKLHRLLSRHSTEAKFLPADLRTKAEIVNGTVQLSSKLEKLVAQKFIAAIEPLLANKKLGALLLQLAPSFRPKSHSLTELDNVLSLFAEFPLAVELRNRFWLEGEQSEATVKFFKHRNTTLVSVDAPPDSEHFTVMQNVDFVTRPDLAYFRLHGRNAEAYVKGRTVADRFNYDYSDEELTEFSDRVAHLPQTVKTIYIVLNNNRHRFAPDAALRLIKILEKQPTRFSVLRPRQEQASLI